jgi:hypothetical protein
MTWANWLIVPLGRFERPTRGLGKRGSLNLPDLKLKLQFPSLNDLQFFSSPRSQISKIIGKIRGKVNTVSLVVSQQGIRLISA